MSCSFILASAAAQKLLLAGRIASANAYIRISSTCVAFYERPRHKYVQNELHKYRIVHESCAIHKNGFGSDEERGCER